MLIDYWNKFRDEFSAALRASDLEELDRAWHSSTARTRWYCRDLLTRVASGLDLTLRTELFKVDAALCHQVDGHSVPLIFVESENDAMSAHHEMWKLCSLASPLKVLITCVEWCDEPGYWAGGGKKAELMADWSRIIRSHNEAWPQPAVYGVIVGERKGRHQRFYSLALGGSGRVLDPERLLMQHEFDLSPSLVEMTPLAANS